MKTIIAAALLLLVVADAQTARAQSPAPEYTIGIDDVLQVIVWDNKDLEREVIVRPDGKISFPLAGEIEVKGLTAARLAEILQERLAKSVKAPNVSVMVKEIRSFRVHFLGRIGKPGAHPIKRATRLLQALSLAGGALDTADLSAAFVIRGEEKIPVDLRRLIHQGDLRKNLLLETDDTIVVPEVSVGSNPQEMQDRRIYVIGKVARPGVYTLKRDVPLLHALFLAGGVADGGDMAAAFIVRGTEKMPVDIWRLIQKGDLAQNVMIRHEDTIVVPSGGELQNAVYVMGEVNKPGLYQNPEALSLLKVVTLAGGFTKYAAPSRATLIRTEGGAKQLMKIDLKDIMADPKTHEDRALQRGDVLIIPERMF